MPNGTGRGIALGISSGVDNFLNSYLSVKNMQQQEKHRKLEPQIDLVKTIINNPNIPLSEQMKAVDSLDSILGLKSTIPLSEQLGLKHLSEQQVETEPGSQGTPSSTLTANGGNISTGTPSNSMDLLTGKDTNTLETSSDINPNIQTKATKSIPAKYKSRGEMSANDYAIIRQQQMEDVKNKSELARQKEVLSYQSELAKSNLKATGYNKVIESQAAEDGEMTDTDGTKVSFKKGDYLVTGINSSMEKKTTNLGSSSSIKEVVARTTATNKSAKESVIVKSLTDYYKSQGQDEETAHANALKDFQENYKAGTEYKVQGAAGTRKSQPEQTIDNQRAEEAANLKLKETYDNARAAHIKSSKEAKLTAIAANTFYKNNIEGYIKGEAEGTLSKEEASTLQRNKIEYERLKGIADATSSEDESNKAAHEEAEKNYRAKMGGVSQSQMKTVTRSKQWMQTYSDKHFDGSIDAAVEYNRKNGVKIIIN